MICFKDKTFCGNKKCDNKNCDDNQSNIDKEKLKASGLELCVGDFWKHCSYHKELLKKDWI